MFDDNFRGVRFNLASWLRVDRLIDDQREGKPESTVRVCGAMMSRPSFCHDLTVIPTQLWQVYNTAVSRSIHFAKTVYRGAIRLHF